MRRRLAVLSASVLAAFATSACVSPRDDEAGSSYATDADRICRRVEQELDTLPTPKDAPGFRTYLTNVERIDRRILDGLGDLELPERNRDSLRRVVELAGDRADVLGQLRVAVQAGDDTQTGQLSARYRDMTADLERQASAFGFTACFQDTRVAQLLADTPSIVATTVPDADPSEDTVPPDDVASDETIAPDDSEGSGDAAPEDAAAEDAAAEDSAPDESAADTEATADTAAA